jgi:ubiquinone/menaquinone biosynthesis C-methylase UbiE
VRNDCFQYACDPCVPLVEIAQSQHPSVDILVANGTHLPYANTSMDVVYSIAVFHHIPDEQRTQFLREVDRVLEPSGIFFATVWAPSAILPKWEHRGGHIFYLHTFRN